ncbi:Fanconi anemia group A protein [Stegastes partitus]|uniref:Fanconi anemia group A protein n=1 Tax=Stegastes partitus TaxID=144197 RepID=A0A9Y4KJ94_9TELE|nr:PREDICTED: Fanconi anemia group A protein [Stegastes partitus]
MSLSASCASVSQKRTLSSLLAGRVLKRPKQADVQQLQEAAIQLLEQQQNLCSLFREVGVSEGKKNQNQPDGVVSGLTGSLLAAELRRQAERLGVSATVLSVKMVLERLQEITEERTEDERREMLTDSQRVQLGVLLQSGRELLSQGVLSPTLLWQELSTDQRRPRLEVVFHLHRYTIVTLQYIVQSDEGLRCWLASQLKALCGWTPPQEEDETKRVQHQVLAAVVGVLVGSGFERSDDPAAADRRVSPTCCSVLDDMLFWLLDAVDTSLKLPSAGPGPGPGPELWIQMLDVSLCGASASAEALQRFFTHCLTQTLTYRPRLTVSDAVAQQNQWTFARAGRLLTSLYRRLAVMFSVEQLLNHLQQVLETHEVNWRLVLCFVSTLLVYSQSAQSSLRELLSRLLSSAFEGYDLENMITAFLLARQASLEGAGVFPSYSDWFKMSFGGGSSYHANSKKSLVFLLKFLSDLVPFEPPQYLKVHILHPPYVPVKHRSLLMEYVSLAKTRLADLQEPVEDMGLYQDASAAGLCVQPQCQAAQDVDRAVSLFQSTGRISATVMEASIFRRPYFLTRFLPALLTPRLLPVKADARMSFIEALKRADKIPAAQHASYVESCHKQRQHNRGAACSVASDDPVELLKAQLLELTELVVGGDDGETSAQLSRISHTLSVVFPGRPDQPSGLIRVDVDAPPSPELHVNVVDVILRSFCQCVLDTSRANPPSNSGSRLLLSRLCVAAVCYGICRSESLPQHRLQDFIPSSIYKKLLYLIPRLLPGVRRAAAGAGGREHLEENLEENLWSSVTDSSSTWRTTAGHLWRNVAFQQLQQEPEYQLSFSDWLNEELRVQRSEDVLSDAARQEYQHWACWELYLPRAEEDGGCGGDVEKLCSHLVHGVMQLQLSGEPDPENLNQRASEPGGCLPDLLTRLQEAVNEMEATSLSDRRGSRADVCDVLFEVFQRFSSSASPSISSELSLQRALLTWNRVLLALPAVLLFKLKAGGGRTTLDCSRLVQHVNQYQRPVCSPVGLLSCSVTSHLLRGLLCASLRCERPDEEFNRAWSQISLSCPLLLVSTAFWWQRLSPVVASLWRRRTDGDSLPQQLQHIADAQNWTCSLQDGQLLPTPPAADLSCASSLHAAWRRCDGNLRRFSAALGLLRAERDSRYRQLLVFLFSLCVNDYLSALLHPQQKNLGRVGGFCSELLALLVDSPDWLLIFRPTERGIYQSVSMVASDRFIRLRPWAFCSLLLQQSPELLQEALRCPGFFHTAVSCYISTLQLFLDGDTPATSTEEQVEPSHILKQTRTLILTVISQSSPAALSSSSSQLRQLQALCADVDPDVDPDVAAALLLHLDPPSLSPEMDFL